MKHWYWLAIIFAAMFAINAYGAEKIVPQGNVHQTPASVSPAFEQALQACNKKFDAYSQLTNSLAASGCNRFGEDKYAQALKAKSDFESCVPLLKGNTAVAKKQSADKALSDFAEQCVCRKKMDNMDANLATLEKMQNEGCLGPTPAYSLDQATSSINVISAEWNSLCRGIVSTQMDNDMRYKQQKAQNSETRVSARCGAVAVCKKYVSAWNDAANNAKKMADNKCQGKLYGAIADAKGKKDVARQNCEAAMWNAAVPKANESALDSMLTGAVKKCTTKDEILSHRCPFTEQTHVHKHSKTGGWEKTIDVWINSYWCREDEDMPICESLTGVTIKLEKENWVVYSNKDIDVTVQACVDPSDWSRCKALTSTGECTAWYTKCKTYSRITSGKCIEYE
jgi:hypothetical protein